MSENGRMMPNVNYFLVGLGIGSAVAILLAPKSGQEEHGDDDTDDGERALEVLEPLENRQVKPFWPRDVLRVSRVCFRSKLCGRKMSE